MEPIIGIKGKIKMKGPATSDRHANVPQICHKCEKVTYIWSRCHLINKENQGAIFIFAIGNGMDAHAYYWIIDSGLSIHLFNNNSLLTNPKSEYLTAANDGSVLRVTQQEAEYLRFTALGVVNTKQLVNVQYAGNVTRNI